MRLRLGGLVVGAALLAVAMAGCGGDGSPGAAKEAYIKAGDAICAQAISASNAAGNAQDQTSAQKQADIWNDAAGKFKNLPQPTESIEIARQVVTDLENLSLAYTAAARSLAVNNQSNAQKYFGQVSDIRKKTASDAKKYGFKECSQV